MQVDADELPVTIGTVQRHDDSRGYTFRVGGQGDRVNLQTNPSVHGNTRVQGCSRIAVSARLSRNLRLPVGIVRIEVKGGMGEEFPGKVGLKHEISTARNILCFYDNMLHCTNSDRERSGSSSWSCT